MSPSSSMSLSSFRFSRYLRRDSTRSLGRIFLRSSASSFSRLAASSKAWDRGGTRSTMFLVFSLSLSRSLAANSSLSFKSLSLSSSGSESQLGSAFVFLSSGFALWLQMETSSDLKCRENDKKKKKRTFLTAEAVLASSSLSGSSSYFAFCSRASLIARS
ncbi:unnamed protein product [Ixodes persulcatus]